MWTDSWKPEKHWVPGLPKNWWRSTHASGYAVGEVDAGRYMATDDQGNGLVDETGDYVAFASPDAAKEYVEAVLGNRMQWVSCERCGGSGELIRHTGSSDPADEYAEICAACEGTGRDCVEPVQ
jgi:hypothetical protein